MSFAILFTIPFIIIFVNKFIYEKKEVSLKEFLFQTGIQVIMCFILVSAFYGSNVHDTEVLNGRITGKTHDRVSCYHDYDCMCTTDEDGFESCMTCYEHSHDWRWRLHHSFGSFTISNVDYRGKAEPSRWTTAKEGQPVAVTNSYTNYRKASKKELYKNDALVEKYKNELPTYPINIYDIHYLNRVVRVGKVNYTFDGWNERLQEINAELGFQKQVNMVVVVTRDKHPEYFHALEQHWVGGKKNDAILVMDVNGENKINWVKAMALTQNRRFQSSLADVIQSKGLLDKTLLEDFRGVVIEKYKRQPMAEFAYLKDSIRPSKGQMIFGFIVSLIIALIGCHVVNNNYERNRNYG